MRARRRRPSAWARSLDAMLRPLDDASRDGFIIWAHAYFQVKVDVFVEGETYDPTEDDEDEENSEEVLCRGHVE